VVLKIEQNRDAYSHDYGHHQYYDYCYSNKYVIRHAHDYHDDDDYYYDNCRSSISDPPFLLTLLESPN
jgi:hypothetical protein